MSDIICPHCSSSRVKKNGHTHNGKQNHYCKDCRTQFVLNPVSGRISAETKDLVKRLLLERLSLRGICRVVGVSLPWLLAFMVDLYAQQPDDLNVRLETTGMRNDVVIYTLEAQADELWSFVGKKSNKQWVWIAFDTHSRQVLAFHVGDRSRKSAKKLWDKIPAAYKSQATFYTDEWEAYQGVIPPAQHKAVQKQSGKTNTTQNK